ncbi:exosome component 7 [Phyllostomus discolor]|uniref:Ribosomal RNA-processing protein 42 n=1 Tax=Phyllostomus discolor TaxID=89673 RepID=A0A833ZMP9_9CHIR|nr:exosome component 7 [Phyllostomus discolor]
MGTPKLEKPNEGYLEFFVDCSANATPEFEGRGGDDLGTEIANTLYRIFHNKSSVDLEALCISPREHCWVLYVDVLLLECGGNLFDAISIAVKAALFNTRIPRVRVLEDEEGSKDIELSDDPYDSIRLSVEHVPCIVTLCKIGCRHVVDATLQEEACSLASLLVAVTSKGVVTCVRKVGKGSLDPESIFEMMEGVGLTVPPCAPLSCRPASGWARCCTPPCRASCTRRRAWGPGGRRSGSWADAHVDPRRWSAALTSPREPECARVFLHCYEFKAMFVRVKLNSIFQSGLERLGFFSGKPGHRGGSPGGLALVSAGPEAGSLAKGSGRRPAQGGALVLLQEFRATADAPE